MLDTEFRRLSGRRGPGAGRPTKLYRRSARQVAVTLPQRHYDLAGQILAGAVEAADRDGVPVLEAVHRAAAERGRRLGSGVRRDGGDASPLDAIAATVNDPEYIAQMEQMGEFVDYRDPAGYEELARSDSEMAEGIIRDLGMYGMNKQ